MQERRWTLITVTFNSAEKLRQYWSQIDLSRDDVEWVVVDNASTDDTVAVAQNLGARVIQSRENRGFAAANNMGFAASCSPYVAFVNPDVSPRPETLPELEAIIDQTGAVVAPQLINDDGTPQPNGRGWPYLSDKVLHRLRPDAVAARYRLYAKPGQLRQVVWLMGAVVTARRSVFERLAVQSGPWDEAYFLYHEDSDLAMRARARGIASLVSGDVAWRHGWAREASGFNFSAWRRELRSLVTFYRRHPDLLVRVPKVFDKELPA